MCAQGESSPDVLNFHATIVRGSSRAKRENGPRPISGAGRGGSIKPLSRVPLYDFPAARQLRSRLSAARFDYFRGCANLPDAIDPAPVRSARLALDVKSGKLARKITILEASLEEKYSLCVPYVEN